MRTELMASREEPPESVLPTIITIIVNNITNSHVTAQANTKPQWHSMHSNDIPTGVCDIVALAVGVMVGYLMAVGAAKAYGSG